MRLSDFIRTNMEAILQKWEDFAKTIIPAGKVMTSLELRDHAEQMLIVITNDLDNPQTAEAQFAKSIGKGPESAEETAAETHALTRLLAGFTIDEMVSEYRALRASVLSLWSMQVKNGTDFEIEDITRFNEAIDQALAESVAKYTLAVRETQHIFLGILGHDLRTPLGAVSLGAEVLLYADDLDSRYTKIASRIHNSIKRANRIVSDLLDFTRSHSGGGIPISLRETDIAEVCREIVGEIRAYHPERTIKLNCPRHLIGSYDSSRMEQVFSNLIGNAVEHGDSKEPVMVTLHREEEDIVFVVHNEGEPIAERDLPYIFNPMSRHSKYAEDDRESSSGLGLGLYIANEIVAAHGGRIEINSGAGRGTDFIVNLPSNKS